MSRSCPRLDERSVICCAAQWAARPAPTPWVPRAALLHLINFDEPFGLSVVEALACGTPVIACNRGSMPELIDDGVTGFLVNNVDEAADAISRVGEIDRAVCRAAVSERFTVDRMADRYRTVPIGPWLRTFRLHYLASSACGHL